MYCMKCGGEIPEGGQFCPVCGTGAPQRLPAMPAMPPYQQPVPYQPYPPNQAPPPYPVPPGYPPYMPYPANQVPTPYPVQPGYPPAWVSAPPVPYMVVRMPNPLPEKPPFKKRLRDRWEIYLAQAKENRLETGLSFTAALLVVIGVSMMMLSGL